MDLRSKFLYIRSAKGFVQYAKTQSGDYDHGLVTELWTPTDHCVPVEADPSGSGSYGLESSPVPTLATIFLEYIDDLPTWDRSLFQWLNRLNYWRCGHMLLR
jgi:hypothetical protein